MTYRNELDQAHHRIEQLEEELREEREKHAPRAEPAALPEIRVVPPDPLADSPVRLAPSLDWYLWWPVPVAIVAGVASVTVIHDEGIRWVVRSACAGGLVLSLEALLRWRNGGIRSALCRLLLVLGWLVGGPAAIAAFMVGGEVLAICVAVGAAIGGLIALVTWIVKG